MRIHTNNSRIAVWLVLLLACSVVVHAGYNGVEIEGVEQSRVVSGSITIPGVGTKPLVSKEECEDDTDEDCPGGFGFYLPTDDDLKIDTEVTVELTDPDGNTTRGTGTVTEDGIKVIVQPFPKRDKQQQGETRPPGIRFGGGPSRVETPADNGGLGTVINVGGELAINTTVKYIDGTAYDLEVEPGASINIGGNPWRWTFGGAHFDGDESSVSSVDVATDNVAMTYWFPAPNMSTGLGLGPAGADVMIRNELEYDAFSVGLAKPTPCKGGIYARFGLRYAMTEQTINGSFTSPLFSGPGVEVSATTHQEIQDDRISVYAGFDRPFELSPRIRFGLGAFLEPGFQETEISGTMNTVCQLCGPGEAALELRMSDDESNFSIGGGVQANLTFDLSDRLAVEVGAVGHYNSVLGVADNPQNPAENDANLDTDSTMGVTSRVMLFVKF